MRIEWKRNKKIVDAILTIIIEQATYRFSLRMKNDYSKLFLKLPFIQYFALTRDTIDKGCFLYFFVLAKAKIESIFLF